MKIGDLIKVEITDTYHNGSGIVKIDGLVVFIPYLVKGDVAEIEITDIKKNFALGKCVSLIEKSELRMVPVCESFEKCGGCSLCHVNYEYENKIKKDIVSAAFRRNKLTGFDISDTVSSASREEYRNKATLHFDKVTKKLGLYSEESNEVVATSVCKLFPDSFNRVIDYLNSRQDILSFLKVSEITLKGSGDDNLVVLIDSVKDPDGMITQLKNAFSFVTECKWSRDKSAVYVNGNYNGLKVRFDATAFRQVNNEVFTEMLEYISSITKKLSIHTCGDLYCGSGIIGLYLAAKNPDIRFYGIEINEKSISDAVYNKEHNCIDNIDFVCADSSMFRKKFAVENDLDLVIVDPPRAGLSEKMRGELKHMNPSEIIYVSCKPQTLARDVEDLINYGYSINSVVPFNMFPMTKHVETVVLLSKKNAKNFVEIGVDAEDYYRIKD